jgi:uncharacterized protein YndB with AHSA1/START domain
MGTDPTVMQSAADGVLEPRDGEITIRFQRSFRHSVDDVWDAITRPARLAEWWLPFDAEIVIELVEGGRFEMRSTAGEPVTLSWTVLRVEPPRLLEHTHVDPGSVVRWELRPDGDGCTLVLSQTTPTRCLAIEGNYLVGLHTSLERLSRALDGTPVPWDWDRFAEHRDRYAMNGLATRRESP